VFKWRAHIKKVGDFIECHPRLGWYLTFFLFLNYLLDLFHLFWRL
jgi:hypothetical protein